MPGFSNYTENLVLNWIGNGGTLAAITPYIALFSTAPADDGTGATEVTTTIRTAGRVAASFGNTPTNSTGANSIANDAVVDFGTAVGGATVNAFGIYDAVSGGNLIGVGTITGAPVTVVTGAAVTFPIGSLTYTAN